ncbi:MAG: hypothetical protein ACM3VZ_09860 [Acidobacteriota bacterium]
MNLLPRRTGLKTALKMAVTAGLLALVGPGPSVLAAPPAPGNLRIEWRVLSSAQAREQQAAMNVHGMRLSTQDSRQQDDAVHTLLVLNGGRASLYTGRSVPQTSWQLLLSAPAASTAASAAAGAGAQLLSQTVWIDLGQGLSVRPRWKGGRSLVELELSAQSSQAVGNPLGTSGVAPDGQVLRQEVATTLAVALGQWVVVAQSNRDQTQSTQNMQGTSGSRSPRGTWSTSELDDQGELQLQVRVTQP